MDFESIVGKAKDGLEVACKKAEETARISKLKFDIATVKNKISKAYEALGKLYYEAAVKGEAPDETYTAPIMQDIASKKEEIKRLNKKISEIKGE